MKHDKSHTLCFPMFVSLVSYKSLIFTIMKTVFHCNGVNFTNHCDLSSYISSLGLVIEKSQSEIIKNVNHIFVDVCSPFKKK
jgi:hypothetical protein